MSSLIRTGNCKLGHDCRRVCSHTADADATKQFRPVGVGGVYWALVLTSRYFVLQENFENRQYCLTCVCAS